MIGTKLAHYEITHHLGTGGMGEVYQALDEKLGRSVAIKLLPEVFTHDNEWVARFGREARVLASLNHPNVAAIYGVEESAGRKFLVMELVPGETLAERVKSSPIPMDETLRIATQIAEGLEDAHETGIIHRDLKPANIKLTLDGKVKILDFGLAKAFRDESQASLSNSPTLLSASVPGVILGTAAYMSPEQARAKPVDRRTDIWAFGCVLYEMLTGKKAFRGEAVTDTLAAVIHSEPDWSQLPAATPGHIRDLLRRCLQKDVRARLQAIGDARVAIEEVLSGAVLSQTATLRKAQLWKARLVLSLAGVSIAVVAALVTWNLKPAPARARDVYKQTIMLPPGQRLAGLSTGKPMLAISPDEKHIAYVATAQGEDARQIYLYPMESQEAQRVTGSVGGHTPFFSPDGQWLGFYNGQGKLMKVPVRGGVPEPLTDIVNPYGASWDSEHRIILGSFGSVLQKLSDKGGGASEQLTRLEPGETMHLWPDVLPGDRAVLFSVAPTSAIAVQEFGANEHQNVHQGQGISMPHYLPSGHLVYSQAGSLVAVPFDLRRLEVQEPVPTTVMSGVLHYSVSPEGSLAYVPGKSESRGYNLVQVSRNGTIQRTFGAAPGLYYQPRVSPDGSRVAMDVLEGVPRIFEVWLYDLGADQPIPFTYKTEGDNRHPIWLGLKRLVFQSDREGTRQIFSQLIDGSAPERLTDFLPSPSGGLDIYTFPVSLCDELLTVVRLVPDAEGWVLHMGDASGQGRKTERLDFPMSADGTPQFSPDCRWLAYVSNESGRREVWVRAFPSLGNRRQISTGGGNEPSWNPDRTKRELFYRNGDDMMAVKISDQGSVEGKAERLFTGSYLAQNSYSRRHYDVFPDGSFLMLKNAVEQEQTLTQINIVWGWSEQLKRLVPTGTK